MYRGNLLPFPIRMTGEKKNWHIFPITPAAHPSLFQTSVLRHFRDASVTAIQSLLIIIFAYVFIFNLLCFILLHCCFLIGMHIFNSAVHPV